MMYQGTFIEYVGMCFVDAVGVYGQCGVCMGCSCMTYASGIERALVVCGLLAHDVCTMRELCIGCVWALYGIWVDDG